MKEVFRMGVTQKAIGDALTENAQELHFLNNRDIGSLAQYFYAALVPWAVKDAVKMYGEEMGEITAHGKRRYWNPEQVQSIFDSLHDRVEEGKILGYYKDYIDKKVLTGAEKRILQSMALVRLVKANIRTLG